MPETNSGTDAARVHAVERYRVLDMPPDRVLERVARLAARVFNAPMATVSIVDRDHIWFTASRGFPGGVRQIARDDGPCALVVGADTPYEVLDGLTDPRTSGSAFVHEHRIRFYAGAPIVTHDGHRLGAVDVMDTHLRTVSDEQLAILEDLAAIVMEQLELRLSALDALGVERGLRGAAEDDRDEARLDREHAVRDRDLAERNRDLIEQFATVLQRTLLPPSLPDIDGLALAAYYHPASPRQVGGDFYDVFSLGNRRWAFFIGDVMGHGVDAAVVTSLIRYTLRSAALHYRDPTDGLAELNSVLLREAQPRRFCTVLFGTLEPHADGEGFQVTIATGGHPPALLVDPVSGTADEVRSRGGMLAGLTPTATFDACTVHLRRGQVLLFYTDGLIEARRGANPFDQKSLAAFVAERARLGAPGLIDDIAALAPKLDPDDDIAVMAFGVVD